MVSANAVTYVSNLVMKQAMTLEERLACLLSQNGGRNELKDTSISVVDVHAYNGLCGYNYWDGETLIGQLYMGTLQSGTYVIYKRTYIDEKITEAYDYYDPAGNFFYASSSLDGSCITYESILMDPTNPLINHIYNILYVEYGGTTYNYGNTSRIKFLEQILNTFYKSEQYFISAENKLKDTAILKISEEILRVENDPVLKWTERQIIYKQLKQKRSKILSTKRRAHNFHYMLYDFIVMFGNIKLKYQTFKRRPLNNLSGTFYRHTLGHFFWFVNTVRNNLGYSIAMAIYGPFTFYFITQPMNPHAMWAVGKVRNAYIETMKSVSDDDKNDKADTKKQLKIIEDQVKTQKAAPKLLVYPTQDISWSERMGNFKAMQIAYEEAMVFAERMGRFEQFETQLNFPLTAEAAWMEMELYLEDLNGKLDYFKNLDQRLVKFLKNEKKRTLELQFYIWQKMGQFFIDYPYIVVDQENEQTQRNYYLGRQFVFFEKISKKLSALGMASSPKTHKNVIALANRFKKMKIEGNTVLDTLRKNSKIFQQKNFLSSEEHRDYMKRHWEVLFMQQNKKQEASSFSLQAYTWSVRNAIWLLQTIYSAKRSELYKFVANYNLDNMSSEKEQASDAMNEYLANMFNNLVMEYVSIKKEMVENLPGDPEFRLRENVIHNIKAYLTERDKLFNQNIYASKESKGTRI
ncbi:MAG: hypothetical protein CME66_01090 [Halobacteriovoraceae bacterium]|nr:hypothetical protein [Halobacteriovoraceae bacterium]